MLYCVIIVYVIIYHNMCTYNTMYVYIYIYYVERRACRRASPWAASAAAPSAPQDVGCFVENGLLLPILGWDLSIRNFFGTSLLSGHHLREGIADDVID